MKALKTLLMLALALVLATGAVAEDAKKGEKGKPAAKKGEGAKKAAREKLPASPHGSPPNLTCLPSRRKRLQQSTRNLRLRLRKFRRLEMQSLRRSRSKPATLQRRKLVSRKTKALTPARLSRML